MARSRFTARGLTCFTQVRWRTTTSPTSSSSWRSKTTEGSNSGIYFHTEYQEDGWPEKGYEVQVNNTHTDWRRGSGLYGIDDVREAPAFDDEWYTQRILVEGKRIRTFVDDKILVDFTESGPPPESNPRRVLSSGTFALQGHDPESVVYFRNIMVRPVGGSR